jgi:hypothetical protein
MRHGKSDPLIVLRAVRDHRGACGNVTLEVRAPQLYPDPREKPEALSLGWQGGGKLHF